MNIPQINDNSYLISGLSYYLSNSKSKRDDCECIMACEMICGIRFKNNI